MIFVKLGRVPTIKDSDETLRCFYKREEVAKGIKIFLVQKDEGGMNNSFDQNIVFMRL